MYPPLLGTTVTAGANTPFVSLAVATRVPENMKSTGTIANVTVTGVPLAIRREMAPGVTFTAITSSDNIKLVEPETLLAVIV